MQRSIWKRYFLLKTTKFFVLVLFCFYLLYFLVDYASRSGSGGYHAQQRIFELFVHYLFEFVKRLDILVPFALLISVLRTLTQASVQNECVALLASGISKWTLIKPFARIAFFCVAVLYANDQLFIPEALKEMRHLHDLHTLKRKQKKEQFFIQNLTLTDQTVLLFHDFDEAFDKLYDVYWVKSFDEIYHMKELSPKLSPPTAQFVDLLVRNGSQGMQKKESYDLKQFPEMKFNKDVLLDSMIPAEELSLSELWARLPKNGIKSEKEAELVSVFYKRMVLPWFSFLVVIWAMPICMRFSRDLSLFFIYASSIFCLIFCYLVLDASVVLGSRQVFDPHLVVIVPFMFFVLFSGFRFLKACRG